MDTSVHGIHHVTAIAGDPQQNLDFYVGVMGLRLVKKSVNQDSIHTYHLFYADETGTPGTDLTFFPWPEMEPAKLGVGFTVEVPFAVRPGSIVYWRDHLSAAGMEIGAPEVRFGDKVLPFRDPHGLRLALVETVQERPFVPWLDGPVPPEHQVRGMHSVRLWERDLAGTEALLTQVMGFKYVATEDGWRRYALADGGPAGAPAGIVDLQELRAEGRGRWGVGGVHHVAWRVSDDAEQMTLRHSILSAGLAPTPQIDRFWFRSVYFKEPGGALFELATDGPGFARDEDTSHLGERLILPPWLEAERAEIESGLPSLSAPRTRATTPSAGTH